MSDKLVTLCRNTGYGNNLFNTVQHGTKRDNFERALKNNHVVPTVYDNTAQARPIFQETLTTREFGCFGTGRRQVGWLFQGARALAHSTTLREDRKPPRPRGGSNPSRQLEKVRATADARDVPRLSHYVGRLSGWTGGLIVLVLLCIGSGCGGAVTVDDREVKPLLAAMQGVDQPESALQVFEDHQEQFIVLFIWSVLAVLIVGTVAALLLLLTVGLLAGLIAAGVVSASVVIGVLRRSVSTGFRALFFQIGGVFGLIMGSLGAWVFILLAKLPINSMQPWVIGPLAGVAFGLLAAWMFNFAWGRTVEWIARKLPRRKVVEVETEKMT